MRTDKWHQWLLKLTNKVWDIKTENLTDLEFERYIIEALDDYMEFVKEAFDESLEIWTPGNLLYSTLAFWSQNKRSPKTKKDGWWIDTLPTYISNDKILKSYMLFYEKLQRMPRVYTGMNLFIMLWTQCPEHDNLFFKRSYCDIMSA